MQDKAFVSMCCAFVSFVMFMLMISTSESHKFPYEKAKEGR